MHQHLRSGLVLLGIHSGSFLMEYLYQRWCYPISVSGFVMSLVTRSSTMCTALRETSARMDTLFIHVVLMWIVQNIVKCSDFFHKSD